MGVLAKVLRGDNVRPSRLHTEAGKFCGLDSLYGMLPAAGSWLRHKMTGVYSVRPWWVYSAIREANLLVRPADRVLEVGAGYSTLWLAQRCQEVCSIEENEVWSGVVSDQARALGLHNMTILAGDSRAIFADQIASNRWDIIVIDGPRDRLEIFHDLLREENQPRIVIYDDTDKLENRAAIEKQTPNYNQRTYRGFKPQTLHVCETTIFERAF